MAISAVDDIEVYGELGLAGELRAVQGTLPSLLACQAAARLALIPSANAREAGLLREAIAYSFESLAQRMLSLLPPLDDADSIEVAAIQSLSPEGFKPQSWRQRPLRSPHHSCSAAALVGGGCKIANK